MRRAARCLDFASDHLGHDLRQRRFAHRPVRHHLAVAHDGQVVADLEYFGEIVRDQDEADALRRKLPDEAQCDANLRFGQRRRRLVQDQDPRLEAYRLDDLHHLLEVVCKRADGLVRVDRDFIFLEQALRRRAHGLAANDPEAVGRLVVEQQILGHAHRLNEIDVLMHGDDALLQGLLGAGEPHRPAVELDRSPIRRVHAGDDLGERRFAGAVLTDEAANATRRDREIDAAKGADRGETARQPPAPQQDGALALGHTIPGNGGVRSPAGRFVRAPAGVLERKSRPDDAVTCR